MTLLLVYGHRLVRPDDLTRVNVVFLSGERDDQLLPAVGLVGLWIGTLRNVN